MCKCVIETHSRYAPVMRIKFNEKLEEELEIHKYCKMVSYKKINKYIKN